jgi:MFS family permease
MTDDRLPPLVKRLGWVSFFTDAASEMIYPLLPAFLATLGGGAVALGMMEGIAEAISAWVKRKAGTASDLRGSRKPFVVAGYTIASLARPVMSVAWAPWQIVLLRAIDRTGKGLRSAPRDALVAEAVVEERRGAAFGFHRMMDNAGATLGALLGFALLEGLHLEIRCVFALSIVPALFAVFLVARLREEKQSAAATVRSNEVLVPLPPAVGRYLAPVFVFTLGGAADSFLLLRIHERGLAAGWLPIVWLSLNLAKAVTNVPGGRLADRFGRRRTLAVAWALYAVTYGALGFVSSVPAIWGTVVLYGLYYGLSEGGEKAYLSELAPKEAQGRAFGTLYAVTGLGVLPANALFGALYAVDARAAFLTAGAFAAAGLAVMMTVRRGGARSLTSSGTTDPS